MDRRIAPPSNSDLKTALERFTSPLDEGGFSLFESKQKVLMFAASLGRSRGARLELKQRDAGSAIRFEVFETAIDDAFIFALAIASDGNLKVLDAPREEEIISTFEEYAHGGLVEMNRKCFESGQDPLIALLDLTQDVSAGKLEDIPGLDPNVLRDLMRG